MSQKIESDHPQKTKQGLLPILLLFFGAFLCIGAALYGLGSASVLSRAIYDSLAQQGSTSVSLLFEGLAKTYHDDLRTLHLQVEAQGVRFDELTAQLSAKARQSGFDSITTVIPRGTGYINILDSRFMRGLTPNVDYNTVGSAYVPRTAGGSALERAVSTVAFEKKPYAYAALKTTDGKAVLVTVLPLTDLRGDVIGMALATTSSGLVAKAASLNLPHYLFSSFFGAAALILLLSALLRLHRHTKAMGVQEKPLQSIPETIEPPAEDAKE